MQARLPRLWAWLIGPEREPHPPPKWVFRPIVGIVALRRLWVGVVGLLVFGTVGVYSATTASAAQASDVLPTILGTAAGVAVLVLLIRPLQATLLGFGSWIILAVEVYEDRRALRLPYFWWSSAVGTFGPLVFLMYVQNRRETLANMRPQTAAELPQAAWYADPLGLARLRWWDGSGWTRDVAG